jgi:hypothetical protein
MSEKKPKRSVEQFCRDFLEKAIEEGLVTFATENFSQDFGKLDDPQQLSSGDLIGLANWLAKELRERDNHA